MSTENESQNPPTSVPQTAAPQEETPTVKCCTCDTTLNTDDSKLVCTKPQCRAASCNVCTRQMIEVMFGQPVLSYPLRCGACSTAFDMLEVDQILTKQEYYEQYLAFVLPLFWSKDCLQENEKLAQCPFCPYMEIHTTDACALRFLSCQHPSCGKESCLICLHEITNDHDVHRNLCVTLQSDKELIEKAIVSGSQQHCPHCQLRGLKDDGCTHMVCERCGLSWCYLCGMKEEDCPVDEYADQSLSSHNQEWESHQGRCPMSLVSINELDERWPDTDEECLEFFHRYRTLCQLYDAMKIIGEERLDELNNTFGIIDASGYTMDEIKDHTSRILINYPEENA